MLAGAPRINFTDRIRKIKMEGFVPTMRYGPTGIGYTLETLLGIRENNYSNHDFIDDGQYFNNHFELKSQRVNITDPRRTKPYRINNSMISLVTQSPHEGLSNRKLIETYGYPATDGRDTINLYTTLVCSRYVNGRNVKNMKIERDGSFLHIVYKDVKLSYYDLTKFMKKLENLVVIRTNVKFEKCDCSNPSLHDPLTQEYHEFFHFNEIHIFTNFDFEKFCALLDKDQVKLDLRMHVPKDVKVHQYKDPTHDHGTGFRARFSNIVELYNDHTIL